MTDFDYMVECNARDIALMLMEEKNISVEEALRLLYSSKTFENLKNKNSGLYFQSPGYVYEYLRRELKL
ncbi:MAG: hypothetical protein Q4D64_14805 [Prevotellaceae bacterium]|nr:hypothetical protein [Prevotellaceae bacterium]